jgi:hypothetical protein
MKRWISGLAALALLSSGAGQASAQIIQLTSPAGFNGTDTTANYTGNDGDSLASPYALSAGGNTLTFTNAAAQAFLRADQGNTWTPGGYPNGTKLLWNLNPNTNVSGGAVTISFATSVHELGLSLQQDNTGAGNTTFSFQGFIGATPSATFTVTTSNPSNALAFVGVQDTIDNGITKLVISSVDSGNSSFNNDFVLSPVTFGRAIVATVPEPSPLALGGLCALGLLALGLWGRRRSVAAA